MPHLRKSGNPLLNRQSLHMREIRDKELTCAAQRVVTFQRAQFLTHFL